MSLTKVTYTDHVTKVPASNMNAIQDSIIALETLTGGYGNCVDMNYQISRDYGEPDMADASCRPTLLLAPGATSVSPITQALPISAVTGHTSTVDPDDEWGYQQCADGTLIIWGGGTFGELASNSTATVTIDFSSMLDVEFASVNSYVILAESRYQYPAKFSVVPTRYTSSSARIFGWNTTSASISDTRFSWIAIGRWK